jgi:hypothetical protein
MAEFILKVSKAMRRATKGDRRPAFTLPSEDVSSESDSDEGECTPEQEERRAEKRLSTVASFKSVDSYSSMGSSLHANAPPVDSAVLVKVGSLELQLLESLGQSGEGPPLARLSGGGIRVEASHRALGGAAVVSVGGKWNDIKVECVDVHEPRGGVGRTSGAKECEGYNGLEPSRNLPAEGGPETAVVNKLQTVTAESSGGPGGADSHGLVSEGGAPEWASFPDDAASVSEGPIEGSTNPGGSATDTEVPRAPANWADFSSDNAATSFAECPTPENPGLNPLDEKTSNPSSLAGKPSHLDPNHNPNPMDERSLKLHLNPVDSRLLTSMENGLREQRPPLRSVFWAGQTGVNAGKQFVDGSIVYVIPTGGKEGLESLRVNGHVAGVRMGGSMGYNEVSTCFCALLSIWS